MSFIEEISPLLPYLALISFIITVAISIYKVGRWIQKTDSDMEAIKKNLGLVSEKIDKVPDNFWVKFIDAYKMLEKMKENPEAIKKEKSKDE